MSCDNIPSNGSVLKKGVLFFCRELYPEITSWVEDQLSFPCSMVDRITPVTTAALSKELEEKYGVLDRWPVSGEDFKQWVLEDNFKTKIPCFEKAGVQIVKEAEPYELMKMRLLNGSHCAMACPSYLLGCRKVDEGINHLLIKKFIRNHFMEEVTPTLAPVPGIDLNLYKDTLISRFSNINIGDTILRLTQDGSNRIPSFILKSLSDAIRMGKAHDSLIFALAAWARFMEGTDEQGEIIPIDDVNGAVITEAAKKASSDPGAYLKILGLKDLSPAQHEEAANTLKIHLDKIRGKGMKSALEEFVKG
jgi:mannitol 2-dehydrogenase